MDWKKIGIITGIVLVLLTFFSGCSTTRALESARSRIGELEELNNEGARRNAEFEELIVSERERNTELERVLTNYHESERNRTAAERELTERLSGIFREGSDIVDQLIEGLRLIRTYLEDKGILVEDISSSSDSAIPDSDG